MKLLYLFLTILFLTSCCEPETHNHWAINKIHPGIVVKDTPCCTIIVLDSGSLYPDIIDPIIYAVIRNGDTIINYK